MAFMTYRGIKMVRFSSRKPRHCLLSPKLFSIVHQYADENNFAKYTGVFHHLLSVSE